MPFQPMLDGLTDQQPSGRTRLVLALAEIREEWQETINGRSLLEVETPVGLLLNDVADKLQLTPQERHVFLGGKLVSEVNRFLEIHIAKKSAN